MLSLLPLTFLLLAALRAVRAPAGGIGWDIRDGLLAGTVWTGLYIVIGTEALGLARALQPWPVAAWWLAGTLVLAVRVWRCPPDRALLHATPDRGRLNLALIAVAAAVLLTTGIIAALTPPTTHDCLSYHLPRQLYWIQNASVAHYPATDLRQLEMPPFAEFAGMHLMLLSGGDHQANLVQWFSYLLGAVAASAIARDLGAGPAGQTMAALFTLLNPAAATQAENAKNDLVVALWALTLLWAAARLWRGRACSWRDALLIGTTLGLLMLTKGTGHLLGLAIAPVIAAGTLAARRWRAIPLGVAMVAVAAAINAPHWARNERTFGSPLALPAARGGHDLTNSVHSPAALASNIIRNITLHTGTPWEGANARQERAVRRAHRALAIDVSDPRTTSPKDSPFMVRTYWCEDGQGGSPMHVLLGAGLLIAVLRPRRWRSRPVLAVWVVPFAALLLFCIVLKWQPWHTRLHIPFLALMAPVLGVWLARRRVAIALCALAGLAQTIPGILWNQGKPLLGPGSIVGRTREQILFQIWPTLLPSANEAVDALARLHPASVAFDLPGYSCEYAPMRMTLDRLGPGITFYALRPHKGPAAAARPTPPDAVLSLNSGVPVPLRDPMTGVVLMPIAGSAPLLVYTPQTVDGGSHRGVPALAFFGWKSEEGLRPAQGPYPEFDLPVVRWADTPVTTLKFRSDGVPTTLIMEVRRNDRVDQEIVVRLNGQSVRTVSLGNGWQFIPVRIPLSPQPGENILTLEYANINEPGPPRSALFRRLQILPSAWLEHPAGPTQP